MTAVLFTTGTWAATDRATANLVIAGEAEFSMGTGGATPTRARQLKGDKS